MFAQMSSPLCDNDKRPLTLPTRIALEPRTKNNGTRAYPNTRALISVSHPSSLIRNRIFLIKQRCQKVEKGSQVDSSSLELNVQYPPTVSASSVRRGIVFRTRRYRRVWRSASTTSHRGPGRTRQERPILSTVLSAVGSTSSSEPIPDARHSSGGGESSRPVRREGYLGDSIEGAEFQSSRPRQARRTRANREGVEEGRLLFYLRVATFGSDPI